MSVELRDALAKYGRHKDRCAMIDALPFERRSGQVKCTCGFDAALATAKDAELVCVIDLPPQPDTLVARYSDFARSALETHNSDVTESIARQIYEAMRWARDHEPHTAAPPWVEHGNSDVQEEARRVAHRIQQVQP